MGQLSIRFLGKGQSAHVMPECRSSLLAYCLYSHKLSVFSSGSHVRLIYCKQNSHEYLNSNII